MSYQPTATSAGERLCVDRYEPIATILGRLVGPFTVLDLGANAGWFTARLADDFGCHVTAVDDHPDLPAVVSGRAGRVRVERRRVTAGHLRKMARYDVVLALSVLHHMPDWREALDVIRRCRRVAIIEVPDPSETWMRYALARRELAEIHEAVASVGELVGQFERIGRDGLTYMRPMYAVPPSPGGSVKLTGTVFGGSGTCSRKLTPTLHGRGLYRQLGYQPFPGSLNLRLERPVDLGPPVVNWPGLVRGRSRPYWFWPASATGVPCHAMDPAGRGHGPDSLEVVAPVKLRDALGLADGDFLTLEVDLGQ